MNAIIVAHDPMEAIQIAQTPMVVAGTNGREVVSYQVMNLVPDFGRANESNWSYLAEVKEGRTSRVAE